MNKILKSIQSQTGSDNYRGDEVTNDVCDKCGGAGIYYLEDNGNRTLVVCDNPIHHVQRWKRYRELSDIVSDDQLGRSLDDIQLFDSGTQSNVAALAAAREFQANPRGWFYVHGTYGNAKSEMALALFNHLRAVGRYGIYLKLQTLVTFLYEAYEERNNREMSTMGSAGRIGLLKRVPVLVIDEFDLDDTKVNITSNLLQMLFSIMDARYEAAIHTGQVTILTANQPPSHLPPALRDRALDGRFVVVENTAPSKRQYMRW